MNSANRGTVLFRGNGFFSPDKEKNLTDFLSDVRGNEIRPIEMAPDNGKKRN